MTNTRKETKMTKREFLNAVIANEITEEIKDFAREEIAKMDKRNAEKTSKQSKKTIENVEVRESIKDAVANAEEAMTAEEIAAVIGITTSKASSLASRMATEGSLVKTDKKIKGKGTRKAYTVA